MTEGRDEKGNIIPGFNGDEIADPSEFLIALFDLLMIEEIRKSRSSDQMSTKVGELFGGTTVQTVRTFLLSMRLPEACLRRLQLVCSNCLSTSETETPFRCPLTTRMPKDIQDPTLEDCLDNMFERKEYMEGLECEDCEIAALRKTTYGNKIPDYLAIEVYRIENDGKGQQWKRNDDLRIDPSKTIDMSRWWPECDSKTAYEVRAIVEHEGE